MNGNVIRTITIRGQAEGLDKLTADVNKLAAAQENVAIVSEQSAKKVLSLDDAWKRQTLRLDEAARAQSNIARETKIADAALREGLATQAQHAQRLEQINQRYATTATATKEFGKQTGLARHELINLGRQAQDVGVSLASGQSPFTVLVQQGAQIADVFASSSGSIRGFFSQAIGWATGFLTSTAGIVTAIGAVGAAAIYVASRFVTASKTIEEALEEQNRLMKIGYDLHSQGLLLLNNEIDLRAKLAVEMEKVASVAEKRGGTPTSVAGEMGEFSGAVAALPGYERLIEAQQTLNAAMAQGQPGFAQFNSTLSQISGAAPGVQATINELLRISEVGVLLEQQAAKVGRIRELMAELANTYPGITFETAKQLQLQEAQLLVAQARTQEEKIVAQEALALVRLRQEGLALEERSLLAAGERAIAETNINAVVQDRLELWKQEQIAAEGLWDNVNKAGQSEEDLAAETKKTNKEREKANKEREEAIRNAEAERHAQSEITNNVRQTEQVITRVNGLLHLGLTWLASWDRAWGDINYEIGMAMSALSSQFSDSSGKRKQYVSDWDPQLIGLQKEGLERAYGAENIEAVTEGTGWGQWTRYQVKPEYLLEVHNKIMEKHSSSVEDLTKSTDALNATMQNALSPFYSQDPRTTKLGFRAGVTGNPDWMTGATNANPLVAVLGTGATAPGMADGGSFVVGGGYSANDNRMAMFPVASGEEIVVNRTPQGRGGQVVNIDNRIFIAGTVGEDALSKMKVSRYQQAQRMRAGMAQA